MTVECQGASVQRYTGVAIALHWAIAVLIGFNLTLGFFMEDFQPALKGLIVPMHISVGITVLLLTGLRVLWRLTHAPPPHAEGLSRWERDLSHVVHFALYAAMVLMPLIGWGIISAHPPVGSPGAQAVARARATAAGQPAAAPPARSGGPRFWWVLPLPSITPIREIGETPGGVAPQEELHDEFVEWHAIGGYLMILLLLLHVAGALKHQWFDRQPELQRMGLGRRTTLRE